MQFPPEIYFYCEIVLHHPESFQREKNEIAKEMQKLKGLEELVCMEIESPYRFKFKAPLATYLLLRENNKHGKFTEALSKNLNFPKAQAKILLSEIQFANRSSKPPFELSRNRFLYFRRGADLARIKVSISEDEFIFQKFPYGRDMLQDIFGNAYIILFTNRFEEHEKQPIFDAFFLNANTFKLTKDANFQPLGIDLSEYANDFFFESKDVIWCSNINETFYHQEQIRSFYILSGMEKVAEQNIAIPEGAQMDIVDFLILLRNIKIERLTLLHLGGVTVDNSKLLHSDLEELRYHFRNIKALTSYQTMCIRGNSSSRIAEKLINVLSEEVLAQITVLDLRVSCSEKWDSITNILFKTKSLTDLNVSSFEHRSGWTVDVALIERMRDLKILRVGNLFNETLSLESMDNLKSLSYSGVTIIASNLWYGILPTWVHLNDNVRNADQHSSSEFERTSIESDTKVDHVNHLLKDNWYHEFWNVEHLWKKLQSQGDGIKIAILDSGVSLTHPSIQHAIKSCKSFVPGEHAWLDLNGHGTQCAGILIGKPTSIETVFIGRTPRFIGIAPKSQLYVGKVIGNNGTGNIEYLIKGLEWAITENCDIISLSVGCLYNNDRLYEIIHTALERGIIIISAAANYGLLHSYNITYPARYGSVICVGGHSKKGQASDFTSAGRELDFLAPGEEILTTTLHSNYALVSGTSIAASFVAGLGALILGYEKKLQNDNNNRKTLIRNTSRMRDAIRALTTSPGHHDQTRGHGIIRPNILLKWDNVWKNLIDFEKPMEDSQSTNVYPQNMGIEMNSDATKLEELRHTAHITSKKSNTILLITDISKKKNSFEILKIIMERLCKMFGLILDFVFFLGYRTTDSAKTARICICSPTHTSRKLYQILVERNGVVISNLYCIYAIDIDHQDDQLGEKKPIDPSCWSKIDQDCWNSVEETLKLEGELLFRKHPTLIAALPYISKCSTPEHVDVCLLLLVHRCDCLAINEEKYPTTLKTTKVEIGQTKLETLRYNDLLEPRYSGSAVELHNNIKRYGTLGGYAINKEKELVAVTAGHVLMTKDEEKIWQEGNLHTLEENIAVLWPSNSSTTKPKKLGERILNAKVLQQIDVGLVGKLSDDAPDVKELASIPVSYLESYNSSSKEPIYYTRIASTDQMRNMRNQYVYKSGAKTGFTKGCQITTGGWICNDIGSGCLYKNQIVIRSDEEGDFTDHGDSGSLVWYQDSKDTNSASIMGLIHKRFHYEGQYHTAAFPIEEIEKALSIKMCIKNGDEQDVSNSN